MTTAATITAALQTLAHPEAAAFAQRFFKTGKGQYGEGDRFLGIRVPDIRRQATLFKDTPLREVTQLLTSPFHEARLCALILMVNQFRISTPASQRDIYRAYLSHSRHINNWDLVDVSAHGVVGAYLESRSRAILYRLARSESLWERRIAIISTLRFIRLNDHQESLST